MDGTDRRQPGERPGLNGDPLGPSFRGGPRRVPATVREALTAGLPFLVLAVVVATVLALR
jgi:hypothetical protein